MKNQYCTLAALALALFISGCAPVNFYSGAGLKAKTGLKYYTVKPFLLVERDLVTQNIVKSVVLYLPDIENPQYLSINDGPGSRKVDIKLENGSVSTLGVAADNRFDDTIDAFSGLLTGTAESVKDLASLKKEIGAASNPVNTELYEVVMQNGTTSLKKIEIR